MSITKGSILLTGANGGIGGGVVTEIIKSTYGITHHALYTVSDPGRSDNLKAILKRAPTDHKHEIVPVDFSSLDSVRVFAADINKRVAAGSIPPLQAVILNAGILDGTSKRFTKDVIERTFGINYLSNFLLVLLLLDSMDKQNGRIIFIGSTSTRLDWAPNAGLYSPEQRETLITSTEIMAKGDEEHPDGKVYHTAGRAYARSKLLMMMFMYELQRRLDTDPALSNISVLGYDPGWVAATMLFRDQTAALNAFFYVMALIAPLLCLFLENPLFRTPSKNGKDLIRTCFDRKSVGEYPKALYIDGTVVIPTPRWANDEKKQRAVWKGSLELVNMKEGDTVLKDWR